MGRLAAVLVALLTTTGLLLGQDPPAPAPAPVTQDPTKPEQAPPQEDATPITQMVETWMKFIQEGDHRGHTHEKISPVTNRFYKYEYIYEGDVDLTISEMTGDKQVVHWSWTVSAQLTEDFSPNQLELSSNFHGSVTRVNIRTIDEKRIIEVMSPPTQDNPEGEMIQHEMAADAPFPISFELLFYRMRQRNLLKEAGEFNERLGASDVQIKLKVENPVMKQYLGGASAYVTPIVIEGLPSESYLPMPSKVFVDKFGRIVESIGRAEGEQFVIAATATEARGGEYVLSARGRRDPFTRSMTPKAGRGVRPTPGKPDEPKIHIDGGKLPEELAKAGKLIDDLERAIKDGSGRAENFYQRFIRVYKPLRDLCKGDPVKLNQLDGYKARAEAIYGGAERLVQRARSLLSSIDDHYNALNEKGVADNLRDIKEMRLRPEFFQDERVIEMERIMREGETKLAQTRARIELQKKELVLTGTVFQANTVNEGVAVGLDVSGGRLDFNEPVKVTYHVTYAVINKKLFGRGDSVDGVVVEDIRPHGVTVSYKGEVREILLKARRETK